MGFVEGITCKSGYIIEDLCGSVLRHASLDTSVDRPSLVVYTAVHEQISVILHQGLLLFAHRTSDVVRLSHRESRKISYDLHYLLLIYRTSVCDIEDRLKERMVISDVRRMSLAVDIFWYLIHRTGSVKRDACDDVLKALRLKLLHE